jgi:hypothetical protein
MLDSSVFQTPDEYPKITAYVKLCESFGRTISVEPSQMLEELEALRVGWRGIAETANVARMAKNDEVFHVVRNDNGKPVATVIIDKETWITMLAMEAMDEDGQEELHD